MIILRSISVISTGARLKVFVASSPPKPAPSITTLGFDCGMVTYEGENGDAPSLACDLSHHEERGSHPAIETLLSDCDRNFMR